MATIDDSLEQTIADLNKRLGSDSVPAIQPPVTGELRATQVVKGVKNRLADMPTKDTIAAKYQAIYGGRQVEEPKQEAPQKINQGELHKKYQAIYGQEGAPKQEEASFVENVGYGAKEAYSGVEQAMTNYEASKSPEKQKIANELNAKIKEEREFYEKNNPGFSVGRLVGNIAAFPILPGAGYLANAAIGAGLSAVGEKSVESSEDYFNQMKKDALFGAAASTLLKGGVDLTGGVVGKALNFRKNVQEVDSQYQAALAEHGKQTAEASDAYTKALEEHHLHNLKDIGRYSNDLSSYEDQVAKVKAEHQAALVEHGKQTAEASDAYTKALEEHHQYNLKELGQYANDQSRYEEGVTQSAKAVSDKLSDLKSKIGSTPSESVDNVAKKAANGDERAARVLNEVTVDNDAPRIIKGSGNLELYNRKAIAGEKFDRVEEKIGGDVVPTTGLKKTLKTLFKEGSDEILPDNKILKILNTLDLNVGGLKVTYSKLRSLRSSISDDISSAYSGMNGVIGTKEAPVIARIKAAIDEDLNNFTKTKGEDVQSLVKDANSYYRNELVPYKTAKVAKALKDAPDDEVMGMFIKQAKEGQAERFYHILEPKGQAAVRYGILEEGVKKATGLSGQVDPTKLAKYIQSMDDPIKTFFKGDDKFELDGLRNVLTHIGEVRSPTIPTMPKAPNAPKDIPLPAMSEVGVRSPTIPTMPKAPNAPKDIPLPVKGGLFTGDETTQGRLNDYLLSKILSKIGLKSLVTSVVGRSFLTAASTLPPKSKAMRNLITKFITRIIAARGSR